MKISNCVGCEKDHESVKVTEHTASNGRPYVRYTCPTTGRKLTRFVGGTSAPRKAPAASSKAPPAAVDVIVNTGGGADVVNVNTAARRAPRSPSPARSEGMSGNKDCKTLTAWTLHGRPQMNICDADILPIVQGLVDGLMARSMTIAPGHALVANADKAGKPGPCCDESGIDIGVEFARVFSEELLRRRIGPAAWLQIMPRELAVAHASGALAMPSQLSPEVAAAMRGPDATATAVGDGVVTIWERLTGAASGAALGGMRGGAVGAALGGMAGALFPELVGVAEQAGEYLGEQLGFLESDDELPLPMPDDFLGPTVAPQGGVPAPPTDEARQMRLVNNSGSAQALNAAAGRRVDLGLNFAGVGLDVGIPLRA